MEKCQEEVGCIANGAPVALMWYSGRFMNVCLIIHWAAILIMCCTCCGFVAFFCKFASKEALKQQINEKNK
jgi:DNA-directed RNA polymerase beta' subunit